MSWTKYYWVWTKSTGSTGITFGVNPPISGWGANFTINLQTSDKNKANTKLSELRSK